MKNKVASICRFSKGDKVKSKHDVWQDDNTPIGGYSLGKETYIVTKVKYWEQGEGYIVYGDKSDKRNRKVWHHEDDLKLIKKNK